MKTDLSHFPLLLKPFIGGRPYSAAAPSQTRGLFSFCFLFVCSSPDARKRRCVWSRPAQRHAARPVVKSGCVSEVSPGLQPRSLPPLWDAGHVNGSWNGEPAVLFLPSHVQVTKQQRDLKEKAIINFAEIASERLVLFSELEDSDPRGRQWRLSF